MNIPKRTVISILGTLVVTAFAAVTFLVPIPALGNDCTSGSCTYYGGGGSESGSCGAVDGVCSCTANGYSEPQSACEASL